MKKQIMLLLTLVFTSSSLVLLVGCGDQRRDKFKKVHSGARHRLTKRGGQDLRGDERSEKHRGNTNNESDRGNGNNNTPPPDQANEETILDDQYVDKNSGRPVKTKIDKDGNLEIVRDENGNLVFSDKLISERKPTKTCHITAKEQLPEDNLGQAFCDAFEAKLDKSGKINFSQLIGLTNFDPYEFGEKNIKEIRAGVIRAYFKSKRQSAADVTPELRNECQKLKPSTGRSKTIGHKNNETRGSDNKTEIERLESLSKSEACDLDRQIIFTTFVLAHKIDQVDDDVANSTEVRVNGKELDPDQFEIQVSNDVVKNVYVQIVDPDVIQSLEPDYNVTVHYNLRGH